MAKEIGEDGVVRHRHLDLHHAEPGALDLRDGRPMPRSAIPKMKWLETVEAQEDNILSFNQATTLINKYGDELKGIFGMTSVATPASAEAVTQAGKCGKIAVVGLATPERDEALRRQATA